jgi:hypothetical protein
MHSDHADVSFDHMRIKRLSPQRELSAALNALMVSPHDDEHWG